MDQRDDVNVMTGTVAWSVRKEFEGLAFQASMANTSRLTRFSTWAAACQRYRASLRRRFADCQVGQTIVRQSTGTSSLTSPDLCGSSS